MTVDTAGRTPPLDAAEPITATRRLPMPMRLRIGIGLSVVLLIATVFNRQLQPSDPRVQSLRGRLTAPGSEFLLGSDQLGRDIAARLLAGLPWSLGVAALSTLCALVIGCAIGTMAGWSNGVVRTVLARAIDVAISFPTLVLVITVIAILGRGFVPLVVTLALASWPMFARVVYAETLGLREREYVTASRLLGLRSRRALAIHVLPGLRPTVVVMAAFTFADMLIAESALSFLGIGAPLGEPTWGNMLADSRLHLMKAPWMMIAPATTIVLAVSAANLLGDGYAAYTRQRQRSIA